MSAKKLDGLKRYNVDGLPEHRMGTDQQLLYHIGECGALMNEIMFRLKEKEGNASWNDVAKAGMVRTMLTNIRKGLDQ